MRNIATIHAIGILHDSGTSLICATGALAGSASLIHSTVGSSTSASGAGLLCLRPRFLFPALAGCRIPLRFLLEADGFNTEIKGYINIPCRYTRYNTTYHNCAYDNARDDVPRICRLFSVC